MSLCVLHAYGVCHWHYSIFTTIYIYIHQTTQYTPHTYVYIYIHMSDAYRCISIYINILNVQYTIKFILYELST